MLRCLTQVEDSRFCTRNATVRLEHVDVRICHGTTGRTARSGKRANACSSLYSSATRRAPNVNGGLRVDDSWQMLIQARGISVSNKWNAVGKEGSLYDCKAHESGRVCQRILIIKTKQRGFEKLRNFPRGTALAREPAHETSNLHVTNSLFLCLGIVLCLASS